MTVSSVPACLALTLRLCRSGGVSVPHTALRALRARVLPALLCGSVDLPRLRDYVAWPPSFAAHLGLGGADRAHPTQTSSRLRIHRFAEQAIGREHQQLCLTCKPQPALSRQHSSNAWQPSQMCHVAPGHWICCMRCSASQIQMCRVERRAQHMQVLNLLMGARATHAWYLATFEDYPKRRRALIPFVL
jgi:3-oxo-5-alpha-steroid 4-dehydrogenase